MLVEVAVAAAVRGTFTYRVPGRLAGEVSLGRRVAVPFGKSPRATGYVIGFPAAPSGDFELRDVADVLDEQPPFTDGLVRLLLWASDYYLAPVGELFRAALPPGLNARKGAAAPERRGVLFAAPAEAAAESLESLSRAAAQKAILEYLLARGRIPMDELRAAFPRGRPALAALVKKGLALVAEEGRGPAGATLPAGEPPLTLTAAQEAALAAIVGSRGGFAPFLLHGVTGSGKTEVYLRAIAAALDRGEGALVLVPEIALTPQLAGRFRARFGEQVALLHSGLSDAERHAEWLRVRRGEAPICVGVRSAVFAPVQNLAVIVVDEEHDGSFKQDETPCYHARDLAVMRAKMEGAVCVLGSATPSLETLENAHRGRYRLLSLPERVDARPLPHVQIVDLSRKTTGARAFGLLSEPLRDALAETVAAGKQAILFLNRRGHATFVLCSACGAEARCGSCDVALTFHSRRNVLLCHYCGSSRPFERDCECGGERIALGVGTEQVEEAVKDRLPSARVGRLDRDAVSSADDIAGVLAAFARRELDILVGTQMVAKGHDFPGVTLVGIVLADTALALPDFRAAERTFQVLAQVAGRAGRGADAGRVLVQTYNPHAPAVRAAVGHDYATFAAEELRRREELGYPPFGRMLAVRVEGTETSARRAAEALGDAARAVLRGQRGVTMLGPAPAAIPRLRNRWRWHLLFKAGDPSALKGVHRALARVAARPPGGAAVRFDMDPQSML